MYTKLNAFDVSLIMMGEYNTILNAYTLYIIYALRIVLHSSNIVSFGE